jgi:hypothetical protein
MGFLSLALFPVPLIFVCYGERLRAISPLANEASSIVFHLRKSKEAAQVPVPVEGREQAVSSNLVSIHTLHHEPSATIKRTAAP